MKMKYKATILFFSAFIILISYLLMNTGYVSDDFVHMECVKGRSLKDILDIKNAEKSFLPTTLLLPAEYYTIVAWYRFFKINDLFISNIVKILYAAVIFCLIAIFFSIYMPISSALFASFLFLFFPSHDATAYWFLEYYITLSIALYLYAFYLADNEKLISAFLLALIASFLSYGSPVIAVSLCSIFALRKKFGKALALIIPNTIFIFYYLLITTICYGGTNKIACHLTVRDIACQFGIQILTFIDSIFGPSMWLKIYYSFFQLSPMSIFIGLICIILFYKIYGTTKIRFDKVLAGALSILLFISLAMFALTGMYPQLSFNLGNRVTVFGSLLIVYLAVSAPLPKLIRTCLFSLLIFSILGISDHWKNWNMVEQRVIAQIQNNSDLKNYKDTRPIYVSGNQYSRFGKIGHIEFLSEEATAGCIFNLVFDRKDVLMTPINKRLKYIDGYILDVKYGTKRRVDDHINIYDSEKDVFFKLRAGDINKYIDSLPLDNRHWIQFVNTPLVRNAIVKLMPRLKYLL